MACHPAIGGRRADVSVSEGDVPTPLDKGVRVQAFLDEVAHLAATHTVAHGIRSIVVHAIDAMEAGGHWLETIGTRSLHERFAILVRHGQIPRNAFFFRLVV